MPDRPRLRMIPRSEARTTKVWAREAGGCNGCTREVFVVLEVRLGQNTLRACRTCADAIGLRWPRAAAIGAAGRPHG